MLGMGEAGAGGENWSRDAYPAIFKEGLSGCRLAVFAAGGNGMTRHWQLLVLLAAGAGSAAAQEAGKQERRYYGNVYGYFTAGACNHGYGIFGGGGGAEGFLWKGISAGVDTSYQQFTDGWGFGFFTPQFGYHFINRNKPVRWDPFVTTGGGAAFTSGDSTGTANLGAGVTYWFKPRLGVRLEYRLHVVAYEEALNTFRIGFSFR
jgi:hypothetical protein